jgi:lipopolysaccharide export LptBFGC system permease protein LptF
MKSKLALLALFIFVTGSVLHSTASADSNAKASNYLSSNERTVVKTKKDTNRTYPVYKKEQKTEKVFISLKKNKEIKTCKNKLVKILEKAGFKGENLKEAWAIAMRESRGQNIVKGHQSFNGSDYSIFQFNKPSWGKQPWWSDSKLADPVYAAKIAYKLSEGGKNWLHWGLTGKGEPNAKLYLRYGWSNSRVQAHIVEPYKFFYKKYPC